MGSPRSHTHTNTLLSSGTITLQELWDDYGIVGDLLVHDILTRCFHRLNLSQPFTTAFPRADIHELLSPDLLHQIIKGAFKDHLVHWVEEYIKNTYPKAQANRILADIDRRYEFLLSVPKLLIMLIY